jgi:hypothetical protein
MTKVELAVIPDDWDQSKDLENAQDTWGIPENNPASFLVRFVGGHHIHLAAALDAAIRWIQRRLATALPIAGEALSMTQKITVLETLARKMDDSPERERLLQACEAIRMAEELRERTMDRWFERPEQVFLLEIGDLGDWLCYVRMELEQTIQYEFDETFTYDEPDYARDWYHDELTVS